MSVLENVKVVADTVHEIKNMELYQRVLDIYGDVIKLLEENKKLREENAGLEKKLQVRGKMKFVEPYYLQEGDRTPFCPGCWESKGLAVHLHFEFDETHRT